MGDASSDADFESGTELLYWRRLQRWARGTSKLKLKKNKYLINLLDWQWWRKHTNHDDDVLHVLRHGHVHDATGRQNSSGWWETVQFEQWQPPTATTRCIDITVSKNETMCSSHNQSPYSHWTPFGYIHTVLLINSNKETTNRKFTISANNIILQLYNALSNSSEEHYFAGCVCPFLQHKTIRPKTK